MKKYIIILISLLTILAGRANGLDLAVSSQFETEISIAMGANPLNGTAHYDWYYGCSPTSGAMMLSYWDRKAGYENLLPGDASVESAAIRNTIASAAHRTAGAEKGYTYGYWGNTASNPNHAANPDCIADFMKTSNAGSYVSNIGIGLEQFAAWDNPLTVVNESYEAVSATYRDSFFGGDFSYDILKNEIDNDRPLMLNVITYSPSDLNWVGHSIVCFGYQDNMFNLWLPGAGGSATVPGVAVDDTWDNGRGLAQWLTDSDADGVPDSVLTPTIDAQGVEWWPLLGLDQTDGYVYSNYWDWTFDSAVTLDITIPEPTSVILLAFGVFLLKKQG